MAIEITKIVTAIEKQIPPIPVVQNASGHIIEFELTDTVGETAEPIDLTDNAIVLIGFKPSGLPITIAGEVIDGNSGQCRVQLTEQALAETGDCNVQLILTDEFVLKTLKFKVTVLPSIILEDIESVPEYQALESALTRVQAAITTVATMDMMADTITAAYQVYIESGGVQPIAEWLAGFTGDPPPLVEMDSRDAYLSAVAQGQTNPNYIYYWGF